MQQQQQQMMQQMQQQIQQARQQAQQQQQQMMQYLQQLQRNQAQRMQQAARQQQRPGQQPQLKDVVTTYEIIIADGGVVRTMALLAPELDEKGRPKKPEAEEKKKLKGDSDAEWQLTGFKASSEELQSGD